MVSGDKPLELAPDGPMLRRLLGVVRGQRFRPLLARQALVNQTR